MTTYEKGLGEKSHKKPGPVGHEPRDPWQRSKRGSVVDGVPGDAVL